jgi:SAM-dependent methyltransferase
MTDSVQLQDAELHERTVGGLHASLIPIIEARVMRTARILDCGAGTGAWAERLRRSGYERCWALDADEEHYRGNARFTKADLDDRFSATVRCAFGSENYDLITAIETIEHLENPTQFLRECRVLLDTRGLLLLTSPNLTCPPARLKFLTQSELRSFDSRGDPTHITPIFPTLFARIAARAGFRIDAILAAPDPRRYVASRPAVAAVATLLCSLFGKGYRGDNSVFLLRRCDEVKSST